jgi:hypothetical protein
MINTNRLNKIFENNTLLKIQNFFSELPITIIKIDYSLSSSLIEYREISLNKPIYFLCFQIGVKKTTETIQDIFYRVDFKFKGENKYIFLNEKSMNEKNALIKQMKLDLGIN